MTDPVLDSITLTPRDFASSAAFYDAVLAALGLQRLAELVDEEEDAPEVEAVAWGRADGGGGSGDGGSGVLWLVPGAVPTTGLHVRLRARSRGQVETFHRAGVQLGAESRAAPRRWAIYRRGEFGAMLADPDGNLVEAVAGE